MVLIGAFGSLGIIVSFLDISLASLVIINMFGVLTMTGVAVEESDRFFEFLKKWKIKFQTNKGDDDLYPRLEININKLKN